MVAIDRRKMLKGLVCSLVAAGFAETLLPGPAEALPGMPKTIESPAHELNERLQTVQNRPPGAQTPLQQSAARAEPSPAGVGPPSPSAPGLLVAPRSSRMRVAMSG
jgi:hypothetical protein